jgi:hypothetical protein
MRVGYSVFPTLKIIQSKLCFERQICSPKRGRASSE